MHRRSYRLSAIGILLFEAACVHVPPPTEPAYEQQLWKEKGCFAHVLPEWTHLELVELAGTVYRAGAGRADSLPQSLVLVRSYPGGAVRQTFTDDSGRFRFADIREGTYELAICLGGFNPWRGTVRVPRTARTTRGTF